MNNDKTILIINPGTSSTKVGIFSAGEMRVNVAVPHNEKAKHPTIWDHYDYLRGSILSVLRTSGMSMDEFDVIACRCGFLKELPGGTYKISAKMIADMQSGIYGDHLVNVGGMVAYDLGDQFKIPVLTADPPMTDELSVWARYSGIPQITRRSVFHALHQRRAARKTADALGRRYQDLNLIVVHLGGGISVGAHKSGKIVDVNNAYDGDGAFSPERAGSLPAGDLVKLCFSRKYTKEELMKLLTEEGGLKAYLGTSDPAEIERRIAAGDEEAAEVYEAMVYQIAKEIGAYSTVLEGKIDAIVLTGCLVNSKALLQSLLKKISFIAPIRTDPGEHEMDALADAAMRFFNSHEDLATYG